MNFILKLMLVFSRLTDSLSLSYFKPGEGEHSDFSWVSIIAACASGTSEKPPYLSGPNVEKSAFFECQTVKNTISGTILFKIVHIFADLDSLIEWSE